MTAVNTFVQNKPILFGATLLDVPNSTTIYASDILFDGKGKKVAPAGLFVAKGQEGIGILKRTRLAKKIAPTSTNALTTIELKEPHFQFKLSASTSNLNGTELWALGYVSIKPPSSSFSLIIDGKAIQISVPASPTIAQIVTAVNSVDTEFGLVASGKDANSFHLFAKDVYSIWSPTAEISTTNPGYFGYYPKKIGRVGTTENLLQNGNREFSIGSATTEVPDDFEIPVNTIVTELVREFIGLYPLDIDLTPGSALESYKTIGAVRVCSGVYENNLPYVDSQIKRELSYLNINKSFMGDLNQVSNSALYIAGADTIVA